MIYGLAYVVTNCQRHKQEIYTKMDGISILALGLGEGFLQESLNKLIAGLGGGAIAWYARKKYYERSDKFDKMEKTYQAMFGIEDVDTMEGVVEVIEQHEDDIEKIFNKLEEGQQKRREIEQKITNLREKVESRKNDCQSESN